MKNGIPYTQYKHERANKHATLWQQSRHRSQHHSMGYKVKKYNTDTTIMYGNILCSASPK